MDYKLHLRNCDADAVFMLKNNHKTGLSFSSSPSPLLLDSIRIHLTCSAFNSGHGHEAAPQKHIKPSYLKFIQNSIQQVCEDETSRGTRLKREPIIQCGVIMKSVKEMRK